MLGLVMYDLISGANCGAVPEYYGVGIKQLYYMISQGMAPAFLRWREELLNKEGNQEATIIIHQRATKRNQ